MLYWGQVREDSPQPSAKRGRGLEKQLHRDMVKISERMSQLHSGGSSRQILVESNSKIFAIDVTPRTTVFDLKVILYAKTMIPPRNQRVVFQNRSLHDDETLSSCGIVDGSLISMIAHADDMDCDEDP
jgi:hypothetical protein